MTTDERIKKWKLHPSQRGTFGFELYKAMAKDESIWLVVGDLGYGLFDAHKEDFPDRFINTGAAEFAMVLIAVGLALEGKKPFVYSITPFLLYRPFEAIRNYIDHERIPVRLVGGGRDQDYAHDGFSHYAGDDKRLFPRFINDDWQEGVFKDIIPLWPDRKEEIPSLVREMVVKDKPWYINLTR